MTGYSEKHAYEANKHRYGQSFLCGVNDRLLRLQIGNFGRFMGIVKYGLLDSAHLDGIKDSETIIV